MLRKLIVVLLLVLVISSTHGQQPAPPEGTALPASQLARSGVSRPTPLNSVEAEYSEEARQKRLNGLCLVSLTVDVQGMPQNIKLVRCSDPSFEENSLKAVTKYRFKPAMTQQGTPVPVLITVEINFQIDGGSYPGTLVRYGIGSPPGMSSTTPDIDGVYPPSKDVVPPAMVRFSDEGYWLAAFRSGTKSSCDVLITISSKGKPVDAKVLQCEKPYLDKLVTESLLKSHYKPGSFNGKAVSVRVSLHLEYGGFPAANQAQNGPRSQD